MRKLLFILLSFLLVSSCTDDAPKVLVGLDIIYRDEFRGDRISANDRIIILSQDSIESIPLMQGCIISPSVRRIQELHKNDAYGTYVAFEGDTVSVKFTSLGGDVFSHYNDDGIEFRYITAIDVDISIKHPDLVESIEGNTFQFSTGDSVCTVSFYKKGAYTVSRKTRSTEFVDLGRWYIEQVNEYFFLILDDEEGIAKFQLADFSKEAFKAYDFSTEERESIKFTRVVAKHPPVKTGVWTSPPITDAAEYRLMVSAMNSSSVGWLARNNTWMTSDTLRLDYADEVAAFIDWNSEVIVTTSADVLGFDVGPFDRTRVRVFPVDEHGRVEEKVGRFFVVD